MPEPILTGLLTAALFRAVEKILEQLGYSDEAARYLATLVTVSESSSW